MYLHFLYLFHYFLNIDILKSDAVDIVDDIRNLKNFEERTIDTIYACHVLEHFSRKEYFSVLERWYNLLKPGGVLRLSVPDLEQWFNYYAFWKEQTISEFAIEKPAGNWIAAEILIKLTLNFLNL